MHGSLFSSAHAAEAGPNIEIWKQPILFTNLNTLPHVRSTLCGPHRTAGARQGRATRQVERSIEVTFARKLQGVANKIAHKGMHHIPDHRLLCRIIPHTPSCLMRNSIIANNRCTAQASSRCSIIAALPSLAPPQGSGTALSGMHASHHPRPHPPSSLVLLPR